MQNEKTTNNPVVEADSITKLADIKYQDSSYSVIEKDDIKLYNPDAVSTRKRIISALYMFGHVQSVRPHQGDIFEKLQFKYVTEEAEIATITAPFWAVISQECDLLHDYKATIGDYNNQDKCLQTILLCPAYPKEQVEAGIHLQSLSLKMAEWKGKDLDKILQNQNPRFQYLNTIEIQELPDLIIDFKRVYSFPRQYIYAKLGFRVGTLEILYRESLTQRLTNYTSRIGLPDEIVG